MYTGLSMLLTGRANAASWKGPTMEPLHIQPKSPWKKEWNGNTPCQVRKVLVFTAVVHPQAVIVLIYYNPFTSSALQFSEQLQMLYFPNLQCLLPISPLFLAPMSLPLKFTLSYIWRETRLPVLMVICKMACMVHEVYATINNTIPLPHCNVCLAGLCTASSKIPF